MKKWPRNPKTHAVDVLGESMDRFGYVAPIIIDEKSGRIVAGHGRLDTLTMMKDAGQPAPGRVKVEDDKWLIPIIRGISFKDEKEAEAYLLADNQITILGGYDKDLLQVLLKEHQPDLMGVGFNESDIIAGLAPDIVPDMENKGWTIRIDLTDADEFAKAKKVLKENGFEFQTAPLLV